MAANGIRKKINLKTDAYEAQQKYLRAIRGARNPNLNVAFTNARAAAV